MKNILTMIIVFISFNANSQYIVPVEQIYNYDHTNISNHYFKDINNVLDKFVGNWKYQTTNDLIEITIYKDVDINCGGSYRKDDLHIELRYTQNGNIIYDTFAPEPSYLISGLRFQLPTNTNKYHFMYQEPGQDKRGMRQYLDIEYIPNTSGGQPQLNWSIYTELSSNDGEDVPRIPLNIVFTKLQ